MIALAEYRRTEQCPRCGGPKHICQDPGAETAFEGGDPVRCHIATAVARKQKDYNQAPGEFPEALIWPIRVKGD